MFDPIEAPAFRYRGGKARLRRALIRFMPLSGSTYIEPFAGRANVFFLMRSVGQFDKYILNDIRSAAWLRLVRDFGTCELTALSREEIIDNPDRWDVRLLEPWYRWGGGGNEATLIHMDASDIKQINSELYKAATALGSVAVDITDEDALTCMERYATDPQAFIYLDPPYANSNVGTYSSADFDLTSLLMQCVNARARIAFSEYAKNVDVSRALGAPATRIYNVAVKSNNQSPVKRATEALWTNYSASVALIDFKDKVRPKKESIAFAKTMSVASYADYYEALASKSHVWRTIDWKRVCCLPYVYFDGELAYNVLNTDYVLGTRNHAE